VNKQLSIIELLTFEKENSVWDYTLFSYPFWIHCREPLLSTAINVNRRLVYPTVFEMYKSFIGTIHFLFTQNKYDKVFFLMERTEILEIYKHDPSRKKILFLNKEQEKIFSDSDYISSDFFNLFRLLSRKVSYIFFYYKYYKMMKLLKKKGYDKLLKKYIKIAIGDAVFLKLLSFILSKKNKKIYSGSVIPMGEKFVNSLHSFEVQHGVIHGEHIGYIGIPEVKNTLILYHERYEKLLRNKNYLGQLYINNYKIDFLNQKTNRYFNIVIYTQPIESMQKSIQQFFEIHKPKDVFIQKHPKDYYDYKIDSCFYVFGTIPREVKYPILYTSSIIENFTFFNRDCYIFNLHIENVDLADFLQVYTNGTNSKMIIKDSLKEIFGMIKKDQELNVYQKDVL